MSLIQGNNTKNASAGGFYDQPINQSLRFNDDDSAYLSWTPASAGSLTTWTFSAWVKRGIIGPEIIGGTTSGLFSCASTSCQFYISSNDSIVLYTNGNYYGQTDAVFRDPSAWYHIVGVWDTTNATSADRIRIYVNGERQSFAAGTEAALNATSGFNSAITHAVGRLQASSNGYTDGYMAEVHFIDGTALDASSFGETKSGVWIPKAYAGSYGTNGFYLPFNHDYSVEGFSATTYKGNSSNQYIGGVGFEPDLVWIKSRNNAGQNAIYDSVRGATINLISNLTDAEYTYSSGLNSFESDGFNVGNLSWVNSIANTYVAWCWDAGSGSPVSNTNGSITSTVKANPTYGFSIVDFTTTSGVETTGHGLSSAPEMIITKKRDGVNNWFTYHTSIGATKFLYLNEPNSAGTSTVWNDTAPTSSVFTTNASQFGVGNYIAYCFHSVSGYSKIGSYTGTGATDQPITTGFRPAMVMVKKTNSLGDWTIHDNVRSNGGLRLYANEPDVEGSGYAIGFTDTGFTLACGCGNWNNSGDTYIYMAFADKREAAFWLDQSGNNNDFTNNNLTESDISLDSPTNNFATLNPLSKSAGTVLSEGNMKFGLSVNDQAALANFGISSGKWYFETYYPAGSNPEIGLMPVDQDFTGDSTVSATFGGVTAFVTNGGTMRTGAWATTDTTGLSAQTGGGVIAFAVDADNGKMWFTNTSGTWFNSGAPASGTNPQATFDSDWLSQTGGGIMPRYTVATGTSSYVIANFGQDSSFAGNKTAQGNTDDNGYGDFYYAPPTGYLALCTANLTVPDAMNPALDASPQDYFNTVLYTGTGTNNSITGVGFSPDLLWFKARSAANLHVLQDRVRGIPNYLSSNNDYAEDTNVNYLQSFDADGFEVKAGGGTNDSGTTYVTWCWKADGTTGVSNTNGSITSTVSANTDAGFSIITYTGDGGTTSTIGHGLSEAPDIAIFKCRSTASTGWIVNSPTLLGTGQNLILNTTAAKSYSASSDFVYGASTIQLDYGDWANGSGRTYVCYAFHNVEGFSKFGTYTGNGSTDGTFVYTGFRPAFLLIKQTNSTPSWYIWDAARDSYNVAVRELYPNLSNAEGVASATVDFLSNGFKFRTSSSGNNASGGTYIYMAFAENPFKYANAR